MKVLIHDGGRHLRTYGFGRVARSIIDGIRANGDTALFSCAIPDVESQRSVAYEASLYRSRPDDADICIQIGQPKSSIDRGSIPLLFYTMFDTHSMPMDWKHHFQKADRIIVPTEQNAASLRRQNISTDVLPLYDNTGLFKDRPDWRDEGSEQFSFIFVGTFSYRKATDQLLESFLEEFEPSEARLILVCSESNPDFTFNYICDLQNRANKVMNIQVVTQSLSDAWLNRYYNRADCFVSASKGEGWGYPMMESALAGLPCLIPDKLVSTEFLRGSHNYHIPSNLKRVDEIDARGLAENFKSSYAGSDSSVVEVTSSDLRKTLRLAQSKGREHARKIGALNRRHVLKNLNSERFNKGLETILNRALTA